MKKGSRHSEVSLCKMRRPRGEQRLAVERFEEKIERNGPTIQPELGPCHLWTGKRRRGQFRYGQFFYRGRWVEAHRFAYERAHGTLPKGQCALHHCDNPQCVREEHLFAGTRAVNVADMDRKGRRRPARGERQRDAKLTEKTVSTLRWAFFVMGVPIRQLSKWYELGATTVGNAIHRRTWNHLPVEGFEQAA